MIIAKELRAKKLKALAESEGVTLGELLEHAVTDSACPGICVDAACDYTIAEIEPDQRAGYCEGCGRNTVQSCLVLFGVI